MGKVGQKNLYRIMDANFNRAKEGLRVCEDICRFLNNKKTLTGKYKQARHQLSAVMARLKIDAMIRARDIAGDVGKASSLPEMKRKDINDILYANSQRVKESVRVLEEFAKLMNGKSAGRLKQLRYRVYALEKELTK